MITISIFWLVIIILASIIIGVILSVTIVAIYLIHQDNSDTRFHNKYYRIIKNK